MSNCDTSRSIPCLRSDRSQSHTSYSDAIQTDILFFVCSSVNWCGTYAQSFIGYTNGMLRQDTIQRRNSFLVICQFPRTSDSVIAERRLARSATSSSNLTDSTAESLVPIQNTWPWQCCRCKQETCDDGYLLLIFFSGQRLRHSMHAVTLNVPLSKQKETNL